MTIAKRVAALMVLLVGIAMALTSLGSGQIMTDQPLNEDSSWTVGKVKLAFAGLGDVVVLPLGLEEVEGGGAGLTFYVGWGGADPKTYSEVREVVEQFHGVMRWSTRPEFNDRGAFISALPLDQARKSFSGEPVKPASLADLRSDVDKFCSFVNGALSRRPMLEQSQDLAVSMEPFEDSEYRVFLVAEPQRFGGTPTSSFDRVLHFGITKEEWLVLVHEVDGSVAPPSSAWGAFLSKLKQRWEIIQVSPGGVVALNDELANSESTIADVRLREATRKIRKILLEASAQELGVIFEPND